MSVRYGIDLVLQPSFTAKLYQTRQIVCGQYSSWAAEMQMLRMPMTPYFPCPDDRLATLGLQVASIAAETTAGQSCELHRTGVAAVPSMNGVVMQFDAPEPLFNLQRKALEAALSHSGGGIEAEAFSPAVTLLEYGTFPEEILPDAAEFAAGIASGLGMTDVASPWRLLLTRYLSEAAGDDWSNGRWASDLSWQQLASHPLYSGSP